MKTRIFLIMLAILAVFAVAPLTASAYQPTNNNIDAEADVLAEMSCDALTSKMLNNHRSFLVTAETSSYPEKTTNLTKATEIVDVMITEWCNPDAYLTGLAQYYKSIGQQAINANLGINPDGNHDKVRACYTHFRVLEATESKLKLVSMHLINVRRMLELDIAPKEKDHIKTMQLRYTEEQTYYTALLQLEERILDLMNPYFGCVSPI
jgi:hypothetical protein